MALYAAANDVAVGKDGTLIAVGGTDLRFGGQAFFVVGLSADTGAMLWQFDGGHGEAKAVVVDDAGDAIVVGWTTPMPFIEPRATAVKLAGGTGTQTWRRERTAGTADDVDVDAAGDVLIAAATSDAGPFNAAALKLDGDDGAILWEHPIDPPSSGYATLVRVLSGNDLALVGWIQPAPDAGFAPVALKLAGADGAEHWRHELTTPPVQAVSSDLAVAPTGSVVVGTTVRHSSPPASATYSVVMLSGVDGAPLWTYESVGEDENVPEMRLAIHPMGDVVASERSGTVLRLDGTTGDVVWKRTVGCSVGDRVRGLAVDDVGDVLTALMAPGCVAPITHLATQFGDLVAAKLTGAEGTERWRRVYDQGISPGPFEVNAVVASATGEAVLAGGHRDFAGGPSSVPTLFTVLTLDAEQGTLEVCRDGHVDAGEDCDDGNGDDADCCSTNCGIAAPDGTACNDEDRCTIGDTCADGACRPGGPLPCAPCGVCTPKEGCRSVVSAPCLTPTASEKAMVTVVDKPRSRGDTIAWEWRSGQATAKTDFGDPVTGSTSYGLCLYGEDYSAPLLVASIPGNAECASGARCWSSTARGYTYRARSGKPDGIRDVVLRSGGAGRASIVVRGRGAALGVPSPPFTGPIRMALVKADGSAPCWEATHELVRTNRSRRFVATNR